jgi:hypothetical protein
MLLVVHFVTIDFLLRQQHRLNVSKTDRKQADTKNSTHLSRTLWHQSDSLRGIDALVFSNDVFSLLDSRLLDPIPSLVSGILENLARFWFPN